MESPNLLWETIGYEPITLYTIEPMQKSLQSSLSHDMAHFYYFLESQFGFTNVRGTDFTYCKSLLKDQLIEPGLLFYLRADTDKKILK